jgi:hypothetical protein
VSIRQPVKPSAEVFVEDLADWCLRVAVDVCDDEARAYLAIARRIKRWKEQP